MEERKPAKKALLCKQSSECSCKKNAVFLIYMWNKYMFIHTYEHAFCNFQSRLFICFGPLLSGRQPRYIEQFVVSKSGQNRPKDNLDLIQKSIFASAELHWWFCLWRGNLREGKAHLSITVPLWLQRDVHWESFALFPPPRAEKQHGENTEKGEERRIDTVKFWRRAKKHTRELEGPHPAHW